MWGESPFRYRVLKLARGSLFSHDCHPCLVLVLIFFFLIFGSLFLLTAGGAHTCHPEVRTLPSCIYISHFVRPPRRGGHHGRAQASKPGARPALLAAVKAVGPVSFPFSVSNDTGYRVLPAAGWPFLLILLLLHVYCHALNIISRALMQSEFIRHHSQLHCDVR